jgi:hypothetical protein
MYDTNNVWKAKSFNLNSGAWSTNGWGVGTKYTISWLQYTTDTTKSAYVGMYTRNSSNVYNFWDGLSFAYNTEVNTWQRVSATFTVTSSWDQTIDYNGIYMYGQYGNVPNTLRIADVQVEIKDAATNFSEAQTRSTTDVWKDTSGNSKHVTFVNSPTYSSSNGGSLVFDGTDDYCLGTELGQLTTYTIDVWFRPTSHPNNNACVISSVYPGSNNTVNFKIGYEGGSGMVGGFFDGGWRLSPSVSTTLNTWQNVVYTYNGSSLSIYSNGVSGGSTSYTGTPNSGGAGFRVGRRWDAADYFAGNIGVIKIYNRALSATEISQNFNAIRGRYGI